MASEALDKFRGDKELLFRRACLFHQNGQAELAVQDYERILSEKVDRVFLSVDPGITGFKAHFNLALALQDLRQLDQAAQHLMSALEECEDFTPAWLVLCKLRLEQERYGEVQGILNQMPNKENLIATKAIMEACLYEAQGDMDQARRVLKEAWENCSDADCLEELSRILTDSQMHDEVVPILELLNAARPLDPAVLHNLGTALQLTGNPQRAIEKFNESLRLRPGSTSTLQQLARAYMQVDQPELALDTLRNALLIAPDNGYLQAAYKEIGGRDDW